MAPTKNGDQSKTSRFQPGNPGGPGRKEGSRNAATLILDAMADGEAETVLRKVLDAAKGGDPKACEIILSRVWPARKGRAVRLDLPEIKSASDVLAALATVVAATAKGEITTDEAAAVASVLELKRRAIETVEIDERLARLEKLQERTQ